MRPLLPGQGCPGDQLLLFTARAGMPWGPVHSSNHSPFLGPQAIPGLAVCLLSFPGPQAIPGLALRLLVLAFHCQGRDAWPGRRPFGPQAIPGLALRLLSFPGPQAIPGLAVCLLSFPGPQAIPGLALRLLVLAFHCQGRDAWPGRRPFGPQAIPGLAVDAFDSILTTTHEARRSPPHRWRRRG